MAKVLTLKGAVIVFYAGQLAAMVLLLFREGNSSGWGDVYAALAVGALFIAVGAGAAVAALFVLRLAATSGSSPRTSSMNSSASSRLTKTSSESPSGKAGVERPSSTTA
jgi:hypothetical protein